MQPRSHENTKKKYLTLSSSWLRGFVVALRLVRSETFKDRAQPLRRRREIFGQDARVADDGHEVGVAVPARHQVNVQMIEHAGAGRAADVDPDVDALRRV